MTQRDKAVWVGVGLLALLGITIIAGHAAAEPPFWFDWGVAAGVGTALGTLALAVATGYLASITAREVALTRQDMLARQRPVIVIEKTEHIRPHETNEHTGEWQFGVAISVRNIGLGPAFHVRAAGSYAGPIETRDRLTVAEHKIIEPTKGSTFRLDLEWTVSTQVNHQSQDRGLDFFVIDLSYQDERLTEKLQPTDLRSTGALPVRGEVSVDPFRWR